MTECRHRVKMWVGGGRLELPRFHISENVCCLKCVVLHLLQCRAELNSFNQVLMAVEVEDCNVILLRSNFLNS